MDLADSLKSLFIETAKRRTGPARRRCMAQTVKEFGAGGQRRAECELGWNRETIRTGRRELESGLMCLDNFAARGRKRAEAHVPNLRTDIAAIVAGQSHADPQFRTKRRSTRRAAAEVRRQVMAQQGYSDNALPTVQTSTPKRTTLGDYPHKVAQREPKKSSRKLTPSSSK